MPNRILREGILTSRRVDRLSDRGEVFYRRLMSKLDDYGRCEADVELIRSACYPLRVNKVKGTHIKEWLRECQAACLLVTYAANGKAYLQYLDWRQQERSGSKFPAPPKQLISDATQGIANEHLVVFEGVFVFEDGGGMPGTVPGVHPPEARNGHDHTATAKGILSFLNEKTGRRYQPVKANLDFIVARLKDGATETELKQVVAKKCREWKGDEKMDQFLRPETLFNRTKFAQYQGEIGHASE
jgi:Conserved phage C-terminus (Phg_2220_C).